MSTQSIPFESINLEPSVPQFPLPAVLTDTSDDGLDPNDFLSQLQTDAVLLDALAGGPDMETSLEEEEKSLLQETSNGMPLAGATPTLSNSLNLLLSRDSLFFSFGNLRDPMGPRNMAQSSNSPLEYLLERQNTLNQDMCQAISLHKEYLASGDDCTGARAAISKIFALLSENSLLLQEVYSKEASRVDETLASFRAWDKKRTKVLLRIQKIKSENNQYGAKLGEILSRRSSIDSEIEALQERLESLKSSRLALDKEVDETMSVLESKSAKYVNMFRNLEKAGTDAVRDYLGTDGLTETVEGPLLRYENVNAMFLRENQKITNNQEQKQPFAEAKPIKPSSPASMGAQAFEIPEIEEQEHESNLKTPHSAYERGYAKGSEQLTTVKRHLSLLLNNVIPAPRNIHNLANRPLGDSLNTITRKLDLKPIVDLLLSKSEALDDLVLQASKVSETFHKHGILWSETCKFLNAQEDLLLQLISTSMNVLDAQKVLEQTYAYLKKAVEEEKNQSILQIDVDKDYLKILTSQELLTIATALDQISALSHYVSSVLESNTNLVPKEVAKNAKDLRYSITSISSQQVVPDFSLPPVASRPTRKTTKYLAKILEKDIKKE